jgi:hypothetical protein
MKLACSLLVLAPLTQDVVERGTPWYWPVGDAFRPGRILQGYGQYETIAAVPSGYTPDQIYDVHKGLDVEAEVDEEVRAPIAGTVLGIWCPDTTCPEGSMGVSDPYGSVILAAESGDWGLTVTHLYDITVQVGDAVAKGQVLGKAVEWTDPADFTHAHLGLFSPQPTDPYAAKTYIGNPLVFLGGRTDKRAPYFRTIENGTDEYWPVAFISDWALKAPLEFHAHDSLPQEKLDILARVADRFSTYFLPPFAPSFELALPIEASFLPRGPFVPFYWPSPAVAPACLSVQIIRDADGKRVFHQTIEFTRSVSDKPYLEPDGMGAYSGAAGWPDPDFYLLLTHSETDVGCWDTADPDQGGEGNYLVELTLEDAAGNIEHRTLTVTVGPP